MMNYEAIAATSHYGQEVVAGASCCLTRRGAPPSSGGREKVLRLVGRLPLRGEAGPAWQGPGQAAR